jgi:hypothetical protein
VDRVKFVIQDGEITVSAADQTADVYIDMGSMTWEKDTAFITFFDNNAQESTFNFFVSVKITGFRDPVSA